jgi:hypothetical protein
MATAVIPGTGVTCCVQQSVPSRRAEKFASPTE